MTAEEFRVAKRALGETDDHLAATLRVAPHVVRAWGQGTARIPDRHAKHIEVLVAEKEREVALATSGLPECAWFREHEHPPATENIDELLKHAEALDRHTDQCPTCQAREQYITDHFPDLPSPPAEGLWRLFEWVKHGPPIARPAAVGAVLLAALVLVEIVFALPRFLRAPDGFVTAALAVLGAAGAGIIGGLVYSLTRPTFKRLGRPGDYLAGIVCVFAYATPLAVVARFVLGEAMVEGRWMMVGIASIVFGPLIGHTLFRSEPVASK